MAWTMDPTHSSIEFSVKHMMISTVRGRFREFGLTAELDPADLSKANAQVSIDVDSIDTREEGRDKHLRTADFFDAANHPTINFVSKRFEPKGDGEISIIGDLTIRGVTKEVTLKGEVSGPQKDPWGGIRMGLSAEGQISRDDFGVNFNAALETGGFLVGNNVKILIEAELVEAKAA
ncbi:MAG TPA: YceI family protein [Tepidiformaceae bacterium]